MKAARIGPLFRCLYLDETDQGVSACDGIIRPRLEIGERRFANGDDRAGRQAHEFGEVLDERFQRRAQLVLGCAARTWVREFRSGFKTESGNGFLKCHALSLPSRDKNSRPAVRALGGLSPNRGPGQAVAPAGYSGRGAVLLWSTRGRARSVFAIAGIPWQAGLASPLLAPFPSPSLRDSRGCAAVFQRCWDACLRNRGLRQGRSPSFSSRGAFYAAAPEGTGNRKGKRRELWGRCAAWDVVPRRTPGPGCTSRIPGRPSFCPPAGRIPGFRCNFAQFDRLGASHSAFRALPGIPIPLEFGLLAGFPRVGIDSGRGQNSTARGFHGRFRPSGGRGATDMVGFTHA